MKGSATFLILALLAATLGIAPTANSAIPSDPLDIYSWGSSFYGQVGNGMVGFATTPVDVSQSGALAGRPVATVSAGWAHTCALDTKGRAYCWGDNYYGQLGTGSFVGSNAPTLVDTSGVLDGKVLTDISAGLDFTCAVDDEGHAYCWGDGVKGQLGNDTSGNSPVPVPVDATGVLSGRTLTAIASGSTATCTIDAGGRAYCWGEGTSGQLGNGESRNSPTPVAVDTTGALGGIALSHVAAGGSGAMCALGNKAAFCWGANGLGQLGNGTQTNAAVPVAVDVTGLDPLVDISMGSYHSCVLEESGHAYCWGANSYGQLGRGNNTSSLVPVAVDMSAPSAFTAIGAGTDHTCAISSAQRTYCWGNGAQGRLGDDSTIPALTPSQVSAPLKLATMTDAGGAHACAVDTGGRLHCWGSSQSGQVGDARVFQTSTAVSIAESGALAGVKLTAVSAGDMHSCALSSSGGVRCWGANDEGQLGNGNRNSSPLPVVVDLAGKSMQSIGTGHWHTCGLSTDGQVYCWGGGGNGQLGVAGVSQSSTPVPVTGLSDKQLTSLAVGSAHTCALDSDGMAYCWGAGNQSQLGNGGNDVVNPTPVRVVMPAGVRFTALSAGGANTCAVDTQGNGWCWGANNLGQLGAGSTTDSNVPIAVDTSGELKGHSLSSITTGSGVSCGLDHAGRAYCWGLGSHGFLGNGTTTNSSVPVSVSMPTGRTFSFIEAGMLHVCASGDRGGLFCWGWNAFGQLGTGDTTESLVPVAVSGLPTAVATSVSCGNWQTLVVMGRTSPDPPTGVVGTAADGAAVVSWVAPDWDGTSAITGYTVTGSPGGSCTSGGTSCAVVGLTNGTPYTFTVTATNAVGASEPSTPSGIVTPFGPAPSPTPTASPSPTPTAPPVAAPGKVRRLKVVVRTSRAIVKWRASAAAASYQVRVRKPAHSKYGAWKPTTAHRYVVHPLKPGKNYRVQIRAIGPGGIGPPAAIRFTAKRR